MCSLRFPPLRCLTIVGGLGDHRFIDSLDLSLHQKLRHITVQIEFNIDITTTEIPSYSINHQPFERVASVLASAPPSLTAVTIVVVLDFTCPTNAIYPLKDGFFGSPTSHWAALDATLARASLGSLRQVKLLVEVRGDPPSSSEFLELGLDDLRSSLPRLAASDIVLDFGRQPSSERPY